MKNRQMNDINILKKFRYAHRGFHDKPQIPENSMPAFERAIEHGFGVEFDVRLIKDGTLVVAHDSSLKRCMGEEGIIENLTLEEVKKLRLERTENQVPTFDEVLNLFESSGLPLVIELKHHGANHYALAKAACERLDNYKGVFCVESFDPRVLMDLKKLRPGIIRGQLAKDFVKDGEDVPAVWQRYLLTDLFFNFITKPHFISYRFEDRANEVNQRCIKKGLLQFNWTICNKEDLLTVEKEGAVPIFERFNPNEE